jgi:hypothetical protein
MTACEYSAMITGIACMLAKDKSIEELGLLAAMFYQLGRTVETMAIYNDICIKDDEVGKILVKKSTDEKSSGDKTAEGIVSGMPSFGSILAPDLDGLMLFPPRL